MIIIKTIEDEEIKFDMYSFDVEKLLKEEFNSGKISLNDYITIEGYGDINFSLIESLDFKDEINNIESKKYTIDLITQNHVNIVIKEIENIYKQSGFNDLKVTEEDKNKLIKSYMEYISTGSDLEENVEKVIQEVLYDKLKSKE